MIYTPLLWKKQLWKKKNGSKQPHVGRWVVPCRGPPYHVVVAPPIALWKTILFHLYSPFISPFHSTLFLVFYHLLSDEVFKPVLVAGPAPRSRVHSSLSKSIDWWWQRSGTTSTTMAGTARGLRILNLGRTDEHLDSPNPKFSGHRRWEQLESVTLQLNNSNEVRHRVEIGNAKGTSICEQRRRDILCLSRPF